MMLHGLHTDEDTISLLRRLAVHYPDDVIAGILNRQGHKTANGERFTANQVGALRRYRNIPRYEPPTEPPTGEVVPIRKAAEILGIYPSTVHRWLNDGFIAGTGNAWRDRKSTRLNSSHGYISYAVFCLKKKKKNRNNEQDQPELKVHNDATHSKYTRHTGTQIHLPSHYLLHHNTTQHTSTHNTSTAVDV